MNKAGFTLMELLIVVIMIGVLTSLAMPQYRKAMDRSKAAEPMEVLPALFEARERWVIENGCNWASSALVCPDSESVTLRKLDTEFPYKTIAADGRSFTTKNFTYYLTPSQTPSGAQNQGCVKAVPRWGGNRGLTGVSIYYRGDKFSCTDGETAGACDILNIADDSHRTGCM